MKSTAKEFALECNPFKANKRLRWKVLDRQTIFRSPIMTLFRSQRIFPCPEYGAEEKRGEFYYFDSRNWVTVIPLMRRAVGESDLGYDVILVEQYRHGSQQLVLEFPAGVMEANEDPDRCAIRELREETGYLPADILCCERIGVSYPNPAIMSNQTYTYCILLDSAARPAALRLDELEALQTHRLRLAELKQLIRQEATPFNNALMLQALFWLENSRFAPQ